MNNYKTPRRPLSIPGVSYLSTLAYHPATPNQLDRLRSLGFSNSLPLNRAVAANLAGFLAQQRREERCSDGIA